MNSNGQADIGYWQMIEMQKDPVAWMYRIKDTDNRWELTWNKPMTEELFDTEPLYTHPHPDNLGLAESIIKQQQLEIEALKKQFAIDQTSPYLNEWSNLVKKQTKQLTNEEILCLWDWWSGEILSTDILDFADTYKRVLLGEEGLLEWHKEYVKKMNEQYPSGKVTEK
jgi:hypothetical protein